MEGDINIDLENNVVEGSVKYVNKNDPNKYTAATFKLTILDERL